MSHGPSLFLHIFVNLNRQVLGRSVIRLGGWAAGLCCLAVAAGAQETPVNFDEHVKPILRQHCWKCHGDDQQEADLNLQNFAALLRGGSAGVVVTAGRASQSRLLQAVTNPDESVRMPPNSPALSDEKIAVLRRWIDGGLRETSQSASMTAARKFSFQPAPVAAGTAAVVLPEKLPTVVASKTVRPLPILAMDVSPRGPLAAIAEYGAIRLEQLETRTVIGRLAFPEGEPHVVRFSQDGRVLMVAGGRPVELGAVVLFDVRNGQRLAEMGEEIDAVLAADLSPDQSRIALGGAGRVVKIFNTADGKLLQTLTKHTDWITSIAFSPDGTKLATGDRAGGLHLWDGQSGGILLNLGEHQAVVHSLAWRSDSKLLASAGEDGRIVWWDASDGFPTVNKANAHPPQRPAGVFGAIPAGVLAVRFNSQGELLSVGRDRQIRQWSADGQPVRATAVSQGTPLSLGVTLDRNLVIVGTSAGEVQFWEPK